MGCDNLKLARRIIKVNFFIILVISILAFTGIIYFENTISDDFKIKKGEQLNIDSFIPIKGVFNGTKASQGTLQQKAGDEFELKLKLFGVIPFSTVNVSVVDELQVVVLGNPFGMRLYTEGVLIIDLTDVETKDGNINPAKKAGLKKGDYILSVDGIKVTNNEDLSYIVEKSKGKEMDFLISRENKKMHIKLCPALSKETATYKIGVWIRDSSAGIGTLTFYSPTTHVICGLGHGICDEDTGTLLELNSGEIVDAEIISVKKGTIGGPGQLKGKFGYETIGSISLNCYKGVYSIPTSNISLENLTEIALKQEISEGEAKILCTIDGNKPELFTCNIEIRNSAYHSDTQNMMVTVTDKKLLEKAGGIVQGMSGAPILQNGKLVGAVTHVLVDDPTKGYAIFAENMLETAQNVAEEQLKAVS